MKVNHAIRNLVSVSLCMYNVYGGGNELSNRTYLPIAIEAEIKRNINSTMLMSESCDANMITTER